MHYANYFAIALGGALGAVTRVALGRVLPESILGLPAHILLVNTAGCLLMGFLSEGMALHWSASATVRYFIFSGFLGAFTTFSAFALEFGLLYSRGQQILALLYAGLSFVLSTVGFFIGQFFIRITFIK